ncbi:MAG TPA: RtcB family protein [Rectinema sp.]|nr:RtcB family protein [Rectinema sp.]
MEIERIDPFSYLIPIREGMHVPARIYASESLFDLLREDKSIEQLVNVARQPGIVKQALGMPDMHQGFAFPIGGVAAFDIDEGIVSPGGVGFDINCGVRVILTSLDEEMVRPRLESIGKKLFARVPSGVGSKGMLRVSAKEARKAMDNGLRWTLAKGFAEDSDLESVESGGYLEEADERAVSDRAVERGKEEFGTLGAGNHFLEIATVERIFDTARAKAYGLFEGQILIWIHTGSRGLGHQVATEYIARMRPKMAQYKLPLYEHDFVSIPIRDPIAKEYLSAMAAAANFAWINRQMITYAVREVFTEEFGEPWDSLGMQLLYDVAHNIAKFETHTIEGMEKRLLVHRKGATRAFPAGHVDLSLHAREVGQPVLLPGDMMRGSYILVGGPRAMEESFGSVAHGAGRCMSRNAAARQIQFDALADQMRAHSVILLAANKRLACEEAPLAYKNVDEVVETVSGAGLASLVARTKPLLVIKG